MKCVFVFGVVLVVGVSLVSAADSSKKDPTFTEQLLREIRKQQKQLQGKSLPELVSRFIEDVRSVGKEVVNIVQDAVAAQTPGASERDGTKRSDKDKTIIDVLVEVLAAEASKASAAVNEDGQRTKREAGDGPNVDIASLMAQLLGSSAKSNEEPTNAETPDPAQTYAPSSSSNNDNNAASTRVGAAPVILIPGPPGKPGIPGLPGLPGKPGKIPNFRGLKAILTTRVAELLAFITVVAVLMVLKFLGLLGLLLGLVLPLYGKLKSAGILVPGEQDEYGAVHEAYGPPQPSYGVRHRRFAIPVHGDYSLHNLASRVAGSVESAEVKFS